MTKIERVLDYIEHHKFNMNVLEQESKSHIKIAYSEKILPLLGSCAIGAFTALNLVVCGSDYAIGFREMNFTDGVKKEFFKKKLYTSEEGTYFKEAHSKYFLSDFIRAM